MTNREIATELAMRMGPHPGSEECELIERALDAAERRGAEKVLEFANGPADWNSLADLQNWLGDGFDLDDSIKRLTKRLRAEAKEER